MTSSAANGDGQRESSFHARSGNVKKTLDFVFVTAALSWLFWPWVLGIVEAARWFLHLPFIHQWDPDRFLMAFLWPLPALLVLVFLSWVYDSFLNG
jgi:hypothetical protein